MSALGANIVGAVEQLRIRALRSALTVLGIVIAVASTITVVSVVQGFTGFVGERLRSFGTNAMWIWPERPAGAEGRALGRITMDLADIEAVREGCDALRRVSPIVRREGILIRHGRDEATSILEGVASNYHAIRDLEVEAGRPFSALDIERAQPVCVLGRDVLRKMGADTSIVGRTILVEDRRMRVIGVLGEKGSFFGVSLDDIVLVPYSVAIKMYPAMRRSLAFAAQADSADAVPEASAQIIRLLRSRHDLTPDQPADFVLRTQDEVLATFNDVQSAALILLAGIVGISLLVGGIGIMNVMLVSVTERTREIGLRKAVGARRRDIMVQFLTEAVVLSLLGGCLGVLVGYALCGLASLHPQMVDVRVPWWAVALGFTISAGTGITFGLLPAIKAALLSPIDALRHE